MLKPLRGRLIAELLPCSYTRPSGIIVIDRKSLALKGKVIAVGKDSRDKYGNPVKCPADTGDIVHFKRYDVKPFRLENQGFREGKVMVWFTDVVAVEVI